MTVLCTGSGQATQTLLLVFLPLEEQLIPTVNTANACKSPLEVHDSVRATGLPNFLKACNPVRSQLCLAAWQNILLNTGTFIYLFGVLHRFQHCTSHIMTGSWKGRGNQYIQFVRVLYCKLLTNGKQLPAFPLEAVTGIEPRPQRWEARVLPLCHHGPLNTGTNRSYNS